MGVERETERRRTVMAGEKESAAPAANAAQGSANGSAKPTKKICCACPETKSARDMCIVEKGECS